MVEAHNQYNNSQTHEPGPLRFYLPILQPVFFTPLGGFIPDFGADVDPLYLVLQLYWKTAEPHRAAIQQHPQNDGCVELVQYDCTGSKGSTSSQEVDLLLHR